MFYSYCVPWVEIRYMRSLVLVSYLRSKLFIEVLASSIYFCSSADFVEASVTSTDI